eukprot:scaffold48777_cov63-Phaeocystis_antarctica.AAC.5
MEVDCQLTDRSPAPSLHHVEFCAVRFDLLAPVGVAIGTALGYLLGPPVTSPHVARRGQPRPLGRAQATWSPRSP